jgi:hypothetical protein
MHDDQQPPGDAGSRVMWDFGTHRVVDLQVSAREQNDVEVQRLQDGTWQRVVSFNSLSCDYAYTNARDAAQRMAQNAQPLPERPRP